MLLNTVNNNIEYLTSTDNIFLEYKITAKKNGNIISCTSLIKNLYDECLYHSKTKEVLKLIKNRKINFNQSSCLKNSVDINEYYSFNQKLVCEYKNQAKKNIYFLINNGTKINNSLKNILSYDDSQQKFLQVVRLLLEYSDNYTLFMSVDSVYIIFKKLHAMEQTTITNNQLIILFEEIIKNIYVEESELLKMFYNSIQLWMQNDINCKIDLINFLAIALYWIIELTQRTKIQLRDKGCIFDPLILLTINDLGYNPWLIFTTDDINFNQICKMNRLLVQCMNIHFSKIHSSTLAQIFIYKNNITVNSYIYFFLARVMPLLCRNKNIKTELVPIEILPQTLLLATYKIFPEIIATAIVQETKDHTTEFIFDRSTFFLGEEFEFRDLKDKNFLLYNEYLVLENWLKKVGEDFKKKGITNYSFANSLTSKVVVNIGGWEYSLFQDGNNLEINTTPYRKQDIFKIIKNNQEIEYTAYQAFDEFIHPLIKFFGYSGISGHKHIDARSLNGNTELLFRLVIDFENNSWLPAAINRLDNCHDYFPYLTDAGNYFNLELIQDLITIINEKKQDLNYTSRYGNFDNLVYLSKLLNFLKIFNKHSPCALHHIIDYNNAPDILKNPTTTVEMRVFNFPKNGHESYLLNTLIEHRINYLLECQKRNEIIEYTPINPYIHYKKNNEILAKFNKYVTECGLDPKDYQVLLKLGITN